MIQINGNGMALAIMNSENCKVEAKNSNYLIKMEFLIKFKTKK